MDTYKDETDKIKNILKVNPRGLSVTDISKEIGINRNTVAKYLEILRISGHIEMESIGTAKVYFLSQRIPISTLLDFSSDYIIVVDRDFKVVQVNDKFSELAKLQKKELIGKKIEDILHPMISNKTLMEKISDALVGKELVEMLDIIVNNELCFLKTKMIPSTFDDGGNGVTLIMENITEEVNSHNILKEEQEKLEKMVSERTTELEEANKMLKKEIMERKWIEEKLHEEREKAQKYLDIAGTLITIIDENGNISLINRKGLEIIECTPEEAIGKNLIDTFVIDQEKVEANKRCYRLLSEECEISCESSIITPTRKNKLIRWTNVSIKDKSGRITGFVASGQDITEQRRMEEELKESEQKYRLLADNTLDSVWQLSTDLVFTYANPGTINVIELGADDLVGTKLQDHFPESEMNKMMKVMKHYSEKGSDGKYTKIKTVIYDKNKNLVPVEIYAKMIFDKDGKLCGYQGTTRKLDVSKEFKI